MLSYLSLVLWHAGVAQSVEQLICNQQVGGSSPSTSSNASSRTAPAMFPACVIAENFTGSVVPPFQIELASLDFDLIKDTILLSGVHFNQYGGIPEWPKGTDCKSAGDAYGGSNPPSPTKTKIRTLSRLAMSLDFLFI